MARIVNYEGKNLSLDHVAAFREALRGNWEETLRKKGGIKQWNANLLQVTEGRRTREPPEVKQRIFYSWCGDWVSYHLEKTGCAHGLALNRKSLNDQWLVGMNLALVRAWSGDPVAGRAILRGGALLRKRFLDDPSSGARAGGPMSWHAWDDKKDVCKDGYQPCLGDLILSPRKNGDHIEFWVKRDKEVLTVSAGAQQGGIAEVRVRNLDVDSISGIIDISGLVPSEPF